MGCGRDNNCLRIANTTYPGLLSQINSNFSAISKSGSEVIDALSELVIPNDYLGTRVRSELKEITNLISEDLSRLSSESSNISSFVKEKISEHKQHYSTWQYMQQKKKKENANDSVNDKKTLTNNERLKS
ncbi:MAG: hypothetical protein J6T31_02210 [Methanobrevibacter sp.]|nr:hypothetical protein [Methanobrevibacter sp.]